MANHPAPLLAHLPSAPSLKIPHRPPRVNKFIWDFYWLAIFCDRNQPEIAAFSTLKYPSQPSCHEQHDRNFNCFYIKNVEAFEKVLSDYFPKMAGYAAFTRQLNSYYFVSLSKARTNGKSSNIWHHEKNLFHRNCLENLQNIKRREEKKKGKLVKSKGICAKPKLFNGKQVSATGVTASGPPKPISQNRETLGAKKRPQAASQTRNLQKMEKTSPPDEDLCHGISELNPIPVTETGCIEPAPWSSFHKEDAQLFLAMLKEL